MNRAKRSVCPSENRILKPSEAVRKPVHAIRREIGILPLFAVRNDRRARGSKPLNSLWNRIFIERSKVRILAVDLCNSLDEIKRSWDIATWLGGYGGWCRRSHTYRVSQA